MRFVAGLLISLSSIVSQAVATEPPTSAQPGQTAPAAASTTAPNSTAKTDPATKGGASESQAKLLRAAGYKAEVRNGQTIYCRKEAQLGSRFESKVCGTADELERLTVKSKEAIDKAQRERMTNK